MAKYWNYRYDLRGDDIDPNYSTWEPGFLDLSLDQGGCLPATVQIWNTWYGDSHNSIYNPAFDIEHTETPGGCSNQGVYVANVDKHGMLSWGDAQFDFGKYLTILATEWKLLHDNGESTEETEHEIYLAVKAATRLDYNGESRFGHSPAMDGFITRDDVPQDFAFDESRFGNRFHWVTSDWSCDFMCKLSKKLSL